jgi:hypothetical protein
MSRLRIVWSGPRASSYSKSDHPQWGGSDDCRRFDPDVGASLTLQESATLVLRGAYNMPGKWGMAGGWSGADCSDVSVAPVRVSQPTARGYQVGTDWTGVGPGGGASGNWYPGGGGGMGGSEAMEWRGRSRLRFMTRLSGPRRWDPPAVGRMGAICRVTAGERFRCSEWKR